METWYSALTALLCVGALWVASGTQGERPLLASRSGAASTVIALEAGAAARPTGVPLETPATLELMQAYLDAHQPGLAVVLLAALVPETRDDLRVRHAYARALIDVGKNGEALTVERGVLAECDLKANARAAPSAGWDGVLCASASRRADILQALLAFGVEDAQRQPEASFAAYQNATREAKIAVE